MVEGGGEVAMGREGEQDEEWVLNSPLHAAAYSGDVAGLQEMLKEVLVDSVDEYGRTAVMYSAMAEREECMELLIKRGASLSPQDSNGQTAVHWAAVTGSYRCLKLLLAKNPDIRVRDVDGRTPLHLATSHASSKCLSALLRKLKSHELNDTDNEKMTALHWSAYNNTPDNIKLLMKAGADIAVTDVDGKTALHWTANNADASCASVLLELAPLAINLKDNDGRTALHLAVAVGNRAVVETLTSVAEVKCDLSAADMEFRTALHWAAVLGSSEMVSLLMKRGAPTLATDAVGATPLHYAAQNNHVDCISVLLSSVAGIQDSGDGEGRTALMWASQRGNYAVLKALLQAGCDPNTVDHLGATALHSAALSGHANCVQLLLQHGASIDVQDANGYTPLFRACEKGHTEVTMVLVHAGAVVLLQDGSGRSCLHWAASGGHSVICSSLLAQGLPVDALDQGGRTALHCAAYGGFQDCVQLLLEAGSDVTLQDSEGITALHWAASTGHMGTTSLLLASGANPTAMEVDGERLTPLDYAVIGQHQELAQLLIEHGALSISAVQDLAAICIQKVYRGHMVRKRLAQLKGKAEGRGGEKEVVEEGRGGGRGEGEGERREVEGARVSPSGDTPSPGLEDDHSGERRRVLAERLRETEQRRQQLKAWSGVKRGGVPSEVLQRDKERVALYRQKTKAALVLQLAWRRYIRQKRRREALEAHTRALQRGSREWRRELAALVIQLAWRQYQRRQLLARALRRQRVLHDWTPSVLAARQKALVQKVYGQSLQAAHYEPAKPRPMVRPAYLHYLPSPAALSFNFAISQYQANLPHTHTTY